MNIKAAATTLCLLALVACSEQKEESTSDASSATESNVSQLKQPIDDQRDVIEMDLGSEIENQIIDTQVDASDGIEHDTLDDDATEQMEVSAAPNTHSIKAKAVTEENAVLRIVEETNVAATYTIKRGDTLGAIANLHNVTINTIVANNNLTDRDSIRIGQQLVIK